uniref:Uncharacterized protein n=1 Tax=Anguilla anguilla TaxID=7936 RepID=A0A0E9QJ18_ANGAN
MNTSHSHSASDWLTRNQRQKCRNTMILYSFLYHFWGKQMSSYPVY